MKISDILKARGFFSKDIRIRLKMGQLILNGEPIKEDVEVTSLELSEVKGEEVTIDDITQDAGNFLFLNIVPNEIWKNRCQVFGFEPLFDTNISNDLTTYLSDYNILRLSKRNLIVIKK